jgi:hypothetical protein
MIQDVAQNRSGINKRQLEKYQNEYQFNLIQG